MDQPADVKATKPAPDLVHSALEKRRDAEPTRRMIGDTPWDVKAARPGRVQDAHGDDRRLFARRADEAGASEVFESVAELRGKLAETPAGGARQRSLSGSAVSLGGACAAS